MTAFIASLLLKIGIPERFHKAAMIAGGTLIAMAAFFTWLHFHDNAVRKADRNAAQAQASARALEAERAANDADKARQAEIQANDADTRKAIDDATAKDPEAAKSPAGPSARAAADSLRKRQAGSHAPAD